MRRSICAVLVAAFGVSAGCATKETPVGPPPPPGTHVGWYVTTTGTSGGDGSTGNPWSLSYALGGAGGTVQPGDTIWVRVGTYTGTFSPNLSGTSGSPIIVRAYPGERVVIDGNDGSSNDGFVVHGTYTYYWGLEFTNSNTTRTTASTSSNFRPDVVTNYATHTKFINLIIHDGGVGFYASTDHADVEIYGCIIYNNGWQGPDRGHGHGLYLKNNTGPVLAKDNVVFNQFGYGIHEYTDAGAGALQNIHLEGNIAFDNGTLSNNSTSANIAILGQEVANGATVLNSLAYYAPAAAATINVKLAPSGLANGTLSATGNYIVGGSPAEYVGEWTTATVSSDTVVGSSTMVDFSQASNAGFTWSNNYYYRDTSASAWRFGGSSYSFGAWKTASGLGGSDGISTAAPAATKVFVRPNSYETGRAHIVVFNWGSQASVSPDVSSVLSNGDQYVVLNVQDLFGTPVASGTYSGGTINIPIAAVSPPAPVGITSLAPNTGTAFAVFLLLRTGP
ncbi:MAG TPA: right-handed parallel beta-helix repeat-containing protein [Gemmatimonadales bacterium]|nr:right-handed parallel beta-helix repeat-containing protein [Gemmatimonadales bacterium]